MQLLISKHPVSFNLIFTIVLLLAACSTRFDLPTAPASGKVVQNQALTETISPTTVPPEQSLADVLRLDVSGSENAYQFSVEIRSPDTGCEQYADWWEVVSEDGDLIYRRILAHSHVGEQPFRRTGGPVAIDADTIVIVRAHMHPHGYGGTVLQGSVAGGFSAVQLEPDFAAGIELIEPLPSGCAF